MIITLESLMNGGIEKLDLDLSFDFSKEEFDGVFPFTTPVSLKGEITNKAGIVRLKAAACFDLTAPCDRCAAGFTKSFCVPVEHILVSELNGEDNNEFIVVLPEGLDIERLTLEDIYLYLPSKLLCRDDCKGVCPSCGADLNRGACGCKKEVDPRLEALLSMLGD